MVHQQSNPCAACTDKVGGALKDQLTGALIGLARAIEGNEFKLSNSTAAVVVNGLSSTLPGAALDQDALFSMLEQVEQEKRKLVPECYKCAVSCGRTDDYDLQKLWAAPEEVRCLKVQILSGIREVAAHTAVLGYQDETIHRFLYMALFSIGMDDWGREELLPIVQELEKIKLRNAATSEKP